MEQHSKQQRWLVLLLLVVQQSCCSIACTERSKYSVQDVELLTLEDLVASATWHFSQLSSKLHTCGLAAASSPEKECAAAVCCWSPWRQSAMGTRLVRGGVCVKGCH